MNKKPTQAMTYSEYLNRVHGGWFGKCLGGAGGARGEGIKHRISTDMRTLLDKETPNDDLDIQLLWLDVLEAKGPEITSDDLADAWLLHCWYPFGEYGYFMRNYARGIRPPYSGGFNNSFFREGMGCPIRSEIWAFINPGNPDRAAQMAMMDGSLDHEGNSCWAEVFLAVMESLAFCESDIPALVRAGLTYIPEDCRVSLCIRMVLEKFEEGVSFDKIIEYILRDFSHPDFTNSPQNLGYTVLAMLFGGHDIEKVINLALSCGYDADCTCASSASIIGVIMGYNAIPDDLKDLLQDRFVCGIDVTRPDDTIYTLAVNTCQVGVAMEKYGSLPIENIPADLPALNWDVTPPCVTIKVDYVLRPGIGFDDTCPVRITAQNNTETEMKGILRITGIPAGFTADKNNISLCLPANGSSVTEVIFSTRNGGFNLEQTNILTAEFLSGEKGMAQKTFGIAGAWEWKVTGPFVEEHNDDHDRRFPPCHPDNSSIPSLEALFSNLADPEKEYLDEKAYAEHPEAFPDYRTVISYEDLIPIDQAFGVTGEATFYLTCELCFPEDCERWIVLGNSDAFKLWLNGEPVISKAESRFWQPHCHGEIVPFKKGVNRISLKLTRRSETVKFSIGIRKYEGNHYHKMSWETDFSCHKTV